MEKIGQLKLSNEIKISDAFDFPEQFSAIILSKVKAGEWLAFNELREDEVYGEVVQKFHLVEENYLKGNPNPDEYIWESHKDVLSIEKGVIGVYDKNFTPENNYIEEMDELISTERQSGVSDSYVACKTTFGNDGYFTFDIVLDKETIVAIRFNLEEESNP